MNHFWVVGVLETWPVNEFSMIRYHVLCEYVEKSQLNMSLEQCCPTDDRNVEMCVSRS